MFKTEGHAPAASEVILINCKERSAAPVGFSGRYLTAEAMSLQSMGRTSLWKSIDQVRSTECIDQVWSEEFPKHYRSPQGAFICFGMKPVQTSVSQLKIKKCYTFQCDDDLKHRSNSTKELLQKKVNILEWSSQNPLKTQRMT